MPTLIATSGPLAGQRFDIGAETLLGREGAEITLADEETSRRHAVVRPLERRALIEDLGSTNGTWVNGARISEPTELHGGETIRLGQSTFQLEPDPEPIADPQSTRIASKPEIADPEATRMRQAPTADPETTRMREAPTADPERTRMREAPATPPTPQPVSDHTQLHPRKKLQPAADAAAAAAHPAAAPRQAAAPPSTAPAPGRQQSGVGNRPSAPKPELTQFKPPAATRAKGIATRRVGPTVWAFGTIIGTAAALVAYFIERGL